MILNCLKRFERNLRFPTRQVNNIVNTPGIYRIFVKRVLIPFHLIDQANCVNGDVILDVCLEHAFELKKT